MSLFPLNIKITGRYITVVGGGTVAERKILKFAKEGACVTVIAPELSPELAKLRDEGAIEHLPRDYREGDLAGAFLAIAATSDRAVNAAVAREAEHNGTLVDVCDDPQASSFTMPAVMTQGDLLITVSTGGKSPALAKTIRTELEATFGPEYGLALRLLGALREKLLTAQPNTAYNKTLLSQLAAHDLPRLIKDRHFDELDRLILQILGFQFSVSRLFAAEKDPR
jgi:precorrin-2 dehydrogenase/sirohydrochlorin ferrochelatase